MVDREWSEEERRRKAEMTSSILLKRETKLECKKCPLKHECQALKTALSLNRECPLTWAIFQAHSWEEFITGLINAVGGGRQK
jgi:hypothetical protein